jgi:hypothetical protein
MAGLSAATCVFFIGIRYGWLGPELTTQALAVQLDKWQIGPLRVVNLIAFAVFFYWLRKYVLKVVAIEPFPTLGKASLRVFCAHIFFVFVGLALLYGDFNSDGLDQLHGLPAIALLAITFTALILVAVDEVRKKRVRREQRQLELCGEMAVEERLTEGAVERSPERPAERPMERSGGPGFQALVDSAPAAAPD